MNKLKNIGISALAGTLVSLSAAQAGEVSVSGAYELSYTNLDHEKVSGNKLGVKKNISFGASGDLSDGGGVTWASNIAMTDAFGLSSASIAINMGGIATLTYDSGGGGTGANAVDNIIPTAWEEVDYGFATGISDVGVVSASKGVVTLAIKAPVAGTGISLSYNNSLTADHVSDGAVSGAAGHKGVDLVVDFVNYDAAHFGYRWGVAAQVEFPEMTCKRKKQDRDNAHGGDVSSCDGVGILKHEPYAGTMYTKLQLGPIHLGTQATFKNLATTQTTDIMNKRSITGGIAAVFGDTLSVSYGVAYDKYRYNDRNRGHENKTELARECGAHFVGFKMSCGNDEHEYSTQKYYGWSAALNLGPVALKGTKNHVKGSESTALYANDTTHSEINLSIAF
jgi:hypothetical protein